MIILLSNLEWHKQLKKIDKKQIYRNIKIEDIATTMSSILNVSQPNAATGTLIYELFE